MRLVEGSVRVITYIQSKGFHVASCPGMVRETQTMVEEGVAGSAL